jgi:hypothetical protein
VSIDREKSLSVLDQALAESRRVENRDDRPRALLAMANAVVVIDPPRVWDTIFEVVKAANSSDSFTGEDGLLSLSINNKKQILGRKFDRVPDFELKGIFSEIAGKDFDRAVQLAHGFQGEAPRANATIVICRYLLNEHPALNRVRKTNTTDFSHKEAQKHKGSSSLGALCAFCLMKCCNENAAPENRRGVVVWLDRYGPTITVNEWWTRL